MENQDKIIITVHHHVLRDTTTRSGYGEGKGFHGSSGGTEGSSYLYFTIEDDDPQRFRYSTSTPESPGPFEQFLDQFQRENGHAAIDLWIGGHTHAKTPEERFHGKGLIEKRWGVTFLQTSGLTRHHVGGIPMSRLLTFTDGGRELRIDLYLHEPYQGAPVGWHPSSARAITLRHPFHSPPAKP